MKRTLLLCAILALVLLLAGCLATLQVNPETGDVKYTRIGKQEIGGLEVEKDGDRVTVKIDSLKNSSTEEADMAVRTVLRALGATE